MHAVVLTFPGHFFQTSLCVQSMLLHYPEVTKISFVLDDVQAVPWRTYTEDFTHHVRALVDRPLQILCSSHTTGINECVAGWWRQQLIKLSLDQILPDDEWFVVDGDVIFQSRFQIKNQVPISRRYDETSRWSQMCVNYVKGVLDTDHGIMHDRDQPVITSPVPFRYLDRDLLRALRSYVESRFGDDFLRLHLSWFQDQTIVADIDPPTKWVMSEWELIECFRQMVQGHVLPYKDIGSGYQIENIPQITPRPNIFIHAYKRDTDVGRLWFEQQGVTIADPIWQRSLEWYYAREIQNLT